VYVRIINIKIKVTSLHLHYNISHHYIINITFTLHYILLLHISQPIQIKSLHQSKFQFLQQFALFNIRKILNIPQKYQISNQNIKNPIFPPNNTSPNIIKYTQSSKTHKYHARDEEVLPPQRYEQPYQNPAAYIYIKKENRTQRKYHNEPQGKRHKFYQN
jgi:hypothetical protein